MWHLTCLNTLSPILSVLFLRSVIHSEMFSRISSGIPSSGLPSGIRACFLTLVSDILFGILSGISPGILSISRSIRFGNLALYLTKLAVTCRGRPSPWQGNRLKILLQLMDGFYHIIYRIIGLQPSFWWCSISQPSTVVLENQHFPELNRPWFP